MITNGAQRATLREEIKAIPATTCPRCGRDVPGFLVHVPSAGGRSPCVWVDRTYKDQVESARERQANARADWSARERALG